MSLLGGAQIGLGASQLLHIVIGVDLISVVVDVLSTRWALLRGDDYLRHLGRMKQVLADIRYPERTD